ncbi:MAG: DUF5412 family protein [Acutalibacteraceae bacterium]
MKKTLKVTAAVLLSLIAVSAVLYYHFFVSMNALPEGELIAGYPSASAACSVNIYRCSSGATVADAVRGEVVFENGKRKNIYWQYRESDAEVKWIDAETVSINGRVLNVYHDKYDFRKY